MCPTVWLLQMLVGCSACKDPSLGDFSSFGPWGFEFLRALGLKDVDHGIRSCSSERWGIDRKGVSR